MTAAAALAVAALVGATLWSIARARGVSRTDEAVVEVASASTPSWWVGLGAARITRGAVIGMVVLFATRWLLLGLLAGVLAVLWGRILHDSRAADERARVEGIAKWLEDLRDTLRSSSMGAEEALEEVARRPPEAIEQALTRFAHRRRQGFRTDDALLDLSDDLAHPTSDAAIAAIRLVVSGSTGAGRLFGTVDALADAARDEVAARERVDRTRAVYQASMKRLVVIGCGLVGYLHVAGGELLDPYDAPVGQVALAVPLAMWVGCIAWLRSLCRYELPARHRKVTA